MRLNPKEQEKLMLHMAGNLAEREKRKRTEIELGRGTCLHQFRTFRTCQRWKNGGRTDAAWHKNTDKG